MIDCSDHICLRAYAEQRNEYAFTTLVERYRQLVFTLCLRRLGDHAAAEDSTQAVFVLLARKAPELAKRPGSGALASWLLTTARYTTSNWQRSQRRRSHHEQQAATPQQRTSSPDDALLEAELRCLVQQALDALPSGHRQALELHYLAGHSREETASNLGISEEALKKRLQRGLRRLREQTTNRLAPHAVHCPSALLAISLSERQLCPTSTHVMSSLSQPAPVVAQLSQGVIQHMFLVKCKTAATALLAAATVTIASAGGLTAIAADTVPGAATETPQERVKDINWQLPIGHVFYTESSFAMQFTPDGKPNPNLGPAANLLQNMREVIVWRHQVIKAGPTPHVRSVPLLGVSLQDGATRMQASELVINDGKGGQRKITYTGRFPQSNSVRGPTTWRLDVKAGEAAPWRPDPSFDCDYTPAVNNRGLPDHLLGLPNGPLNNKQTTSTISAFDLKEVIPMHLQAADDKRPGQIHLSSRATQIEVKNFKFPPMPMNLGMGMVDQMHLRVDAKGTVQLSTHWNTKVGIPSQTDSTWNMHATLTCGFQRMGISPQITGTLLITRSSVLLDFEKMNNRWPKNSGELLRSWRQQRYTHWLASFDGSKEHSDDQAIALGMCSILSRAPEHFDTWSHHRRTEDEEIGF